MSLQNKNRIFGGEVMSNNINTWFNEDITFCANECDNISCRRNQKNIKIHNIPHSFSYFEGTEFCEKEIVKND